MQALVKEEQPASFLSPIGYQADSCGYCKDSSTGKPTPNSRANYYAISEYLSVEDYQNLVDRGWRRSGTVLYKPDVRRHCCPHYTIRLPASEFKPARDQRQAVNRWNKFVLGDKYIEEAARAHPKTKGEKVRERSGFDLVAAIHESEYTQVKHPPEPAHRFRVKLEPDDFTWEKYELFKNYQIHVHHEEDSQVSEKGFKGFLCNSPLQRSPAGAQQQLGSFHQCYRLDGRLIAMGVLDLLPHAVSGVYFIYHPDFEKWSFGKLSALREVALAQEGGHGYYYMGYYIPSCTKMRYKGDYKPQHILDPETYQWDPLDGELMGLLDTKHYVSLSKERKSRSVDPKPPSDANATSESSPNAAEDDFPLATPADASAAVKSGLSLFELKVPGVMTAEELDEQIDLDKVDIEVQGIRASTEELIDWDTGSTKDPKSLKGTIAELAACVGGDVAKSMVVKFG